MAISDIISLVVTEIDTNIVSSISSSHLSKPYLQKGFDIKAILDKSLSHFSQIK